MNVAIILMAGTGQRTGLRIPKQYLIINHRPLYDYCLQTFFASRKITKIVLVTDKDHFEEVKKHVVLGNFDEKIEVCIGGETRKQSVLKAITYLGSLLCNSDIVLIHDGARPLISREIVDANIKAAREKGAAVTACPAKNTLAISADRFCITANLDRHQIYEIQTPQSIQFGLLKRIMPLYSNEGLETDDSQIFIKCGLTPAIVSGSVFNFKITTADDILLFTALVKVEKVC